MKRVWLAVVLIVVACLIVLLRPADDPAVIDVGIVNLAAEKPRSVNPAFPVLELPPRNSRAEETSHPMAVAFGDGSLAAADEPGVLLDLFRFFRSEFGSFPAGEDNAQMMNALRGGNARQLPIFPRTHPRLDEEGALLDAWGKPFVFHLLSSQDIEIRSSGPDGEIYTADDLVVPAPRN